jgi:hypothetical protein
MDDKLLIQCVMIDIAESIRESAKKLKLELEGAELEWRQADIEVVWGFIDDIDAKLLTLKKGASEIAGIERPLIQDLLNLAASKHWAPKQPRIDMSQWSDMQVIDALKTLVYSAYDNEIASAQEELTKRANAKCVTVADYIYNVTKQTSS